MSSVFGKLTGYAKAVPQRVVTNDEISKMVDTSDEWIRERSGIRQRHVVGNDEQCSTLATDAARGAMEMAGLAAEDVDLIIVATSSPDYLTPPVSSQVQHNLGAKNAGAFVMVVGCTGFVSALITADQYIRTGSYRNIVIVGVEVITRMVNWNDRNTCVLFGDGAAAVTYQAVNYPSGILSHKMGSDGSGWEHILHPSGGTKNPPTHERLDAGLNYLTMNGREVFKFATGIIGKTINEITKNAGLTLDDIDLFIPHQANARIIEYAAQTINIPLEKFFINVSKYGNTSAASVPIAITEAFEQNKLKEGDKVALVAFGSGLTWAGCVLQL